MFDTGSNGLTHLAIAYLTYTLEKRNITIDILKEELNLNLTEIKQEKTYKREYDLVYLEEIKLEKFNLFSFDELTDGIILGTELIYRNNLITRK
jgi:hypothetical protein